MTIIVDRSFTVVKIRNPANPTSMMNYGLVDGVNSSFAMIDPDNFDDVHEVVVHSLAFLSESLSGPHSYTASTETTLVNPDPVIGFYQTPTLTTQYIYTYDNPSLNHTDTEYEYFEGDFSIYPFITGDSPSKVRVVDFHLESCYTNIESEMNAAFNNALPVDFIDNVLVPWYQEIIARYFLKINHTVIKFIQDDSGVFVENNNRRLYELNEGGYVLVEVPATVIERRYHNDVFQYENENNVINYPLLQHDIECTTTSYITRVPITVNEGFNATAVNTFDTAGYKFDPKPEFKNDLNFLPIPFDHYLVTYEEDNLHQRIYNYPIGAEIYLHEWVDHVYPSRGNELCVHPSGFFSGSLPKLPYSLVPFPDSMIVMNKIYFNEYYSNFRFTTQTTLYGLDNTLQVSDFDVINIDLLGYKGGATITNQSLYEQAYQHSMTIPSQTFRIRTEDTNYTYIYEQQLTYNETNYWVQFNDWPNQQNYAPVVAGSMLFSK